MPSRAVLVLLVALPCLAADKRPVGASCDKSIECKTDRCSQHRCAPSNNAPQAEGSICENNLQCLTRNCVNKRCGPRIDTSASKTKSTSRGAAVVERREESEEEAPVIPALPPLPPATACTDDLMSTVYAAATDRDMAQRYAYLDCENNSGEALTQAKELSKAGYGYNFEVTLKTLKSATAEQLTCAKKEYDKARDKKYPRDFQVPSICLQSSAVQACRDDLAATVYKDEKSRNGILATAQAECQKRSPEIIARAKALFEAGYGTTNFSGICNELERATPAQVECMKRDYDLNSNRKTVYESFSRKRICERSQVAIDCYFDFLGTFYPEAQFTNDRLRSNVESYCAASPTPDLALMKKLRAAGYKQDATRFIEPLGKLTPEQKSCVLKGAAKAPDAEKANTSFSVPKQCRP